MPDLIHQAIAQAYGPPSEEARQPNLLKEPQNATSSGNKREKTQKR